MSAPWAHPFWNDYGIFLVDLTTPTETPAVKVREDCTHEVTVFALNPDVEQETGPEFDDWHLHPLTPPNHAYQFVAPNDQAALSRIQGIVSNIQKQRLSPDTDFISAWNQLFADGQTLRITLDEKQERALQHGGGGGGRSQGNGRGIGGCAGCRPNR